VCVCEFTWVCVTVCMCDRVCVCECVRVCARASVCLRGVCRGEGEFLHACVSVCLTYDSCSSNKQNFTFIMRHYHIVVLSRRVCVRC